MNHGQQTTKVINALFNDAVYEAADLVSFDNDGFTLDWTTADATAREFIGIAFGDAAAAGGPNTLTLLGVG